MGGPKSRSWTVHFLKGSKWFGQDGLGMLRDVFLLAVTGSPGELEVLWVTGRESGRS